MIPKTEKLCLIFHSSIITFRILVEKTNALTLRWNSHCQQKSDRKCFQEILSAQIPQESKGGVKHLSLRRNLISIQPCHLRPIEENSSQNLYRAMPTPGARLGPRMSGLTVEKTNVFTEK